MSTNNKSKFQQRLEDNQSNIQELLGDEYEEVELSEFSVKQEKVSHDKTTIEGKIYIDGEWEYFLEEGQGAIDALWKSIEHMKPEYPILEDVQLEGYKAEAVGFDEEYITTDSMVDVEVQMSNKMGGMYFKERSHSVLKASVLAFLQLVEYLINSQNAFKKLQFLIEDSQDRNRQDLVTKYTDLLSELTRLISHQKLNKSANPPS